MGREAKIAREDSGVQGHGITFLEYTGLIRSVPLASHRGLRTVGARYFKNSSQNLAILNERCPQ
jgi:hypothetical protein